MEQPSGAICGSVCHPRTHRHDARAWDWIAGIPMNGWPALMWLIDKLLTKWLRKKWTILLCESLSLCIGHSCQHCMHMTTLKKMSELTSSCVVIWTHLQQRSSFYLLYMSEHSWYLSLSMAEIKVCSRIDTAAPQYTQSSSVLLPSCWANNGRIYGSGQVTKVHSMYSVRFNPLHMGGGGNK